MSDESTSMNNSQPTQECHMDNQPFSIDWLNMSATLLPVKMMLYTEKWENISESEKIKWLRYSSMGSLKSSTIVYLQQDKIRWRVEKIYEKDGFSATGEKIFTIPGIGKVLQKIRIENDC